MRIVAWNCAMAFHRKLDALLAERPDVAIVSECGSPEVLAAKVSLQRLGQMVWVGDNPQKGLAVFARNGYTAELDDCYDPSLHHLAPVRIDGGLRPGLTFMTLHFQDDVATNLLTIDATDPKSGTAEFKATAIRIDKLA